jgi:hypothetical protein
MSAVLVHRRPVALPDERDVECAIRAMAADGRPAPRDLVTRALWAARAMPALLDVFADARFVLPQEHTSLHSLSMALEVPGERGLMLALAFHRTGSERVEVRFIDGSNRTVARFTASLTAAVADGDGDVLIRRFSHGGKGPPGDRGGA